MFLNVEFVIPMKRKKHKLSRSEIMSKIRSKDTSCELKVRKRLWQLGYRYRKNHRKVCGTPDICFLGKKVVIFIDSEFWHGKTYLDTGKLPATNTEFWKEKFERNIERDKKVNETLINDGWKVLRFWEKEIQKNFEECINKIVTTLK